MRFKDQVDDIALLIQVLPKRVQTFLETHPQKQDLIEIVLDVGYRPEVRFSSEMMKCDALDEVTVPDIEAVVKRIGAFNTDNRAGIERTLHRISAIRNRYGTIIGLTCRVGRAIEGPIELLRDIIESNQNILFLGPPGIGKTTKLREAARVLNDELKKRVIVVDTSNEIAGDGDIPHPGIGYARRMQVPSPDRQHAVMIEAVENHMPQVIIVDEIGTEAEAMASRTIAERGVQLVATAHGNSLHNLIKNPTLSDLLGGIQSVILGDEEAKFRGSQKTVLERRAQPTFDVLIEIRERDKYFIYHDVAEAVDAYLRNEALSPEERLFEMNKKEPIIIPEKKKKIETQPEAIIFPFGLNTTRIKSCITTLGLSVQLTDKVGDADFILTVRSKVKQKSKLDQIRQGHDIPMHVLESSATDALTRFFKSKFDILETQEEREDKSIAEIDALCQAVERAKKPLEALPKSGYLRRLQHIAAETAGHQSLSVGKEPNRRVRVYPKGEGQ